jgi:hypothetical protein
MSLGGMVPLIFGPDERIIIVGKRRVWEKWIDVLMYKY